MLWDRRWGSSCEKNVLWDIVKKSWWDRRCRKDVIRTKAWGLALCISDALIFSNADHPKSNNYWQFTGDRRPLASSLSWSLFLEWRHIIRRSTTERLAPAKFTFTSTWRVSSHISLHIRTNDCSFIWRTHNRPLIFHTHTTIMNLRSELNTFVKDHFMCHQIYPLFNFHITNNINLCFLYLFLTR